MNLKPAFLQNFMFDLEMCFCLCKVHRFQNFDGLELPIKHTLGFTVAIDLIKVVHLKIQNPLKQALKVRDRLC